MCFFLAAHSASCYPGQKEVISVKSDFFSSRQYYCSIVVMSANAAPWQTMSQ